MTQDGVDAANRYIEEKGIAGDSVYIIFLPEVHESIAGIAAGKLREKYLRPCFVLTDALTDDGKPCLKGSGRSIEKYNMFEGIDEIKDIGYDMGHKL